MTATLILSSAGGICAFIAMITLVIRAIFKQVNATEDNTAAVRDLTDAHKTLTIRITNLEYKVGILEDRGKR